jgi:hypothetical protein
MSGERKLRWVSPKWSESGEVEKGKINNRTEKNLPLPSVEGKKYIRRDENGDLLMKEKKANKALHLTACRAVLIDECCISRASKAVTEAACLSKR